MSKKGGKTTGSGSIHVSGGNGGTTIGGSGKIEHKSNSGNSSGYIKGTITHTKPSGGKGSTQGGIEIGGSTEF